MPRIRSPEMDLDVVCIPMGEVQMRIGGNLRRNRKMLRLTLQIVSNRAHVAIGYISALELGKCMASLRILKSLAKALRISLVEVFSGIHTTAPVNVENNPAIPSREPSDAEKLGARLLKARKAKRLTQKNLQDQTGISHDVISEIERGITANPTNESYLKLATVLEIPLYDFLGEIDG